MKLTDKAVKGLKPKAAKYFVHGDMSNGRHGFAVCVYPASAKFPAGTKSWFFIYRYEGKRCFLPLGKYPAITLADASREFEKHWQVFASGKNPATVEEEKKAERDAAPTINAVCSEYIERHAKKFKRSWATDERILNHDVIPAWGNRKAADIVKRDVILLLEKIMDRGSPIMANNTFAVIRKMFNFAVERDILPHSPCAGVKPPAPKVSCDRALTEAEIRDFWNNLGGCAMSTGVRNALKLILTTAQRPGEVIGMHTSEIDGDWWTIPAERAKNGKTHRVYLSPLAQEIIAESIAQVKLLREMPVDEEYTGFIFPTPHRQKEQAIAPQAMIVAVNRALASPVVDGKGKPQLDAEGNASTVNKIGVASFTPHDLRRTAATFMGAMGFMDEIIDAVLNHAKKGIIRTYNRHGYDKEKQEALGAWGRKLDSIVNGKVEDNVIPIRRKN